MPGNGRGHLLQGQHRGQRPDQARQHTEAAFLAAILRGVRGPFEFAGQQHGIASVQLPGLLGTRAEASQSNRRGGPTGKGLLGCNGSAIREGVDFSAFSKLSLYEVWRCRSRMSNIRFTSCVDNNKRSLLIVILHLSYGLT